MDQSMTGWLKCEVLPGLFENERLVEVQEIAHGKKVSILVDSALVEVKETPQRDRPVEGLLRVIARLTSPDRADVTLPVPSAELGSVISVRPQQLATP